jgi:hypothetical protein
MEWKFSSPRDYRENGPEVLSCGGLDPEEYT